MIYVAGSINLDLIARAKELPKPGETVSGTDFSNAPGGKGANQALAAKRAGSDVVMIGAVGSDSNAQAALTLLKEDQVDLANVAEIEYGAVPTGVALILVAEDTGENQIVVVPGTNALVDPTLISRVSLTATDSMLLQMEIPEDANMAAIDAAKSAGARSILNIAPYGLAAPTLACQADVTIANESEFDALARSLNLEGDDRMSKAQSFSSAFGKDIVITLGAEGALAMIADNAHKVTSPQIAAVDTVGAGDTFCGAFAVALNEGLNPENALEFACTAGALACLNKGAQPAIPRRANIDQMLIEAGN